jgi:hypothetical protein
MRRSATFSCASTMALVAAVACSDPAPPAVSVESLILSLDSIAIQFRDSASELTASPRGALGVELDAEVTWRSKNPAIVTVVPNGNVARLIPVRPGTAELEALAEGILATAKVVVLDTVFSVQISGPTTMVSLGRSIEFSAIVSGPPGASQRVVWSVGNGNVASIDSSQGNSPVLVVSRDTGATTVTATSAIDRRHSATVHIRTAPAVSLFFESQPAQATAPIRANDILIPGPIVRARDQLGNVFLGPVDVTMTLEPGTGAGGAKLFGAPTLTTSNGEGRFDNLGVDLEGANYRVTATAPGLTTATSSTFNVGPECPGTPYVIGATVSGTLTTSSCQSRANEYYDRYIVSSNALQYFAIRLSSAALLRIGVIFPDGARITAGSSDSLPGVVSAGTFSIRVHSSATGATGAYQLRTGPANIPRGVFQVGGPFVCYLIQVHRGITLQDDLKCSGVPNPCNSGASTDAGYRLHLAANMTVTVTVTSSAFDPCLRVLATNNATLIASDPDVPGRNTARVVVPPAPIARNVVVHVGGRATVPVGTPFTISIQP